MFHAPRITFFITQPCASMESKIWYIHIKMHSAAQRIDIETKEDYMYNKKKKNKKNHRENVIKTINVTNILIMAHHPALNGKSGSGTICTVQI